MERAKSFIIVFVLVAVACAMLFDLSRTPRSRYTKANYDRLELGMKMDEAISILGEPDSVDHSMRDMAWVMWYSPFDRESSITAIFVYPSEELRTLEHAGELPDRPLRMPETRPKRRLPSFIKKMDAHQQKQERRAMLMLDPPKKGPVIPAFP